MKVYRFRTRGPGRWTGRIPWFALSLALSLILLTGFALADADPEPAVPGGFTAISPGGDPAANSAFVANPSAPVAGALIYEDFIKIERKAYALLKPNLEFRESISPYNAKPGYLTLVQKFDYQAGLATTIYTGTVTIQQRIDQADAELRQARDLYAFLAVYAPESRFRGDPTYTASLCGAPASHDI